MNNVWLAFITGLTTGGISCFALQGGLLATSVAQQKKETKRISVIMFLVAKILAYTVLGALLGYLGSKILISPKLQGIMQIFAGFVMLVAVAKLLDIHPVFKKLTLTAPKSFFKIIRNESKDNSLLAPLTLGLLTVLIPCGVTQAMMLLSVSSGNIFWGSAILFAFTLGTTPVFLALGFASDKIFSNSKLKYLGAFAIVTLAIMSINTGQVLRGSSHTLQNYYHALIGGSNYRKVSSSETKLNIQGKQDAEIRVVTGGYESETKTLKAGIPVTLKLVTNNTRGCSRAFTIPEYNISKILPETGIEIVEFTPTRAGRLTYTCSMGMYTGWFEII